jgi:hypothetical protein
MVRRFNPTNGEEKFFNFLTGQLEPDESPDCLAPEPDTFALAMDRPGRSAPACTPDIRWRLGLTRRTRLANELGLHPSELPEVIYLELSSADSPRFDSEVKLPARVRRKNRMFSHSGQAYVTPEQYFVYKQERLEAARRRYGVVIVLLRWVDQQAIFAQPIRLEALVAAELCHPHHRPSGLAVSRNIEERLNCFCPSHLRVDRNGKRML